MHVRVCDQAGVACAAEGKNKNTKRRDILFIHYRRCLLKTPIPRQNTIGGHGTGGGGGRGKEKEKEPP